MSSASMKASFDRRRFLKAAGATASASILGGSLIHAGTVFAAPTSVRRNVGGMDASDPILVSYRAAIKEMQALPSSDPRSWAYQAAIHGTTVSPAMTAWNTCEHGTYFFWSWHRMYLYWFERIVRKMACDSCWALPYWDWSSPSQRQLPSMFRDTASELYTSHRNAAINNGTGSLPASHVDYGPAFGLVNFVSASSSLEGTPHGAVHVDIGGWMGSVPTAAQDPIFYLHHCNIDRLWNLWLAQGGGRSDPLSDTPWKTTKFTFFDENAAQVQMTGCEVLRAAQQLHYTYEGEPPQVNQYCLEVVGGPYVLFERAILLRLPVPPVVLASESVSIPFDIGDLRPRLAAIKDSKTERLFLELDEVEAERPPGVVWEVYIGLPTNLAPDSKNAHHVGNVALFGAGIRNEAHHGFQPARLAFPLDPTVIDWFTKQSERVVITFVPAGILVNGKPSRPKAQSQVRIGSVSLSVEVEKRP